MRLAVASAVCAGAAVVAIVTATVTGSHTFWAFAVWVALTVAAMAVGVVALVRTPRTRADRPWRRLATGAVVVGVLCATLGLAVYSSTRSNDCPKDAPCTIPERGPGQFDQQP